MAYSSAGRRGGSPAENGPDAEARRPSTQCARAAVNKDSRIGGLQLDHAVECPVAEPHGGRSVAAADTHQSQLHRGRSVLRRGERVLVLVLGRDPVPSSQGPLEQRGRLFE